MSSLQGLLRRAYRLLIRLYPPDFRRRFDSELLACFDDLVEDERSRRGLRGLLSAFLRTVFEMPASLGRTWLGADRPEPSNPAKPRRTHLVSSLVIDLVSALRGVRGQASLFALAVVSLTAGVAATTLVLSLIQAILWSPPPVPAPERLVRIAERTPTGLGSFSFANFRSVRELDDSPFAGVALHSLENFTVDLGDGPKLLQGEVVSSDYFETLALRPALGTFFTTEDAATAEGPLPVVLGHGLWVRELGADAEIVGATLEINNTQATVVAVADRGFEGMKFGLGMDLWVPAVPWGRRQGWGETWMEARDVGWWNAFARLRTETSRDEAEAALGALAARLETGFPSTNTDVRFAVFGNEMQDATPHLGSVTRTVGLFAVGAGLLVLAVAAANVSALLSARLLARRRELDIRAALGAARLRLVSQHLMESTLVAVASTVLGLGLAYLASPLLLRYLPQLPYRFTIDPTPDLRIASLALVSTLIVAISLSLLPTLKTLRRRSWSLGAQGASQGSVSERGLSVVVVAVVACSFVALSLALLFHRSLDAARQTPTGLVAENRFMASIDTSMTGDPEFDSAAFHRRLKERLDALPFVESSTIGTLVPLIDRMSSAEVFAAERSVEEQGTQPEAWIAGVLPDYFATLGTPLLQGRGIEERDLDAESAPAVINETLASRLWPEGPWVGRRLRLSRDESEEPLEVVGVVADGRYNFIKERPTSALFLPLTAQRSEWVNVVVRSPAPPESLVEALRQAAAAVDDRVPVFDTKSMATHLWSAAWVFRLGAELASALALLALALSVAGLYGVTSHRVQRRRREIGVRMAVGATRREILGGVLLSGLRTSWLGLLAGLTVTLILGGALSGLLLGGSARSPAVLAVVTLALASVIVMASLRPALRASRLNPVTTLRDE